MFYYDSLPGYGLMPGLTNLGKWFCCFGVSIAFTGMLILSIASKILSIFIARKKQHSHKKSTTQF